MLLAASPLAVLAVLALVAARPFELPLHGDGHGPPAIADDPGEQIPGPANPSDLASVAAWRQAMLEWRARMRAKIGYNGSIYDVPALKWTQTSYIQPQMHPYDRYFFDPTASQPPLPLTHTPKCCASKPLKFRMASITF